MQFPKIDRSFFATGLAALIAFGGPLLYGLASRLFFGENSWPEWWRVLTLSFLCGVPFALGALTVFLASPAMRTNWLYALFAPWLSATLFMVAVGILAWEAWICIAMAAPIFFISSMFGGLVMAVIFKTIAVMRNSVNTSLAVLLLLVPYVFGPLESYLPLNDAIRTVETSVIVKADAQTVWANIIRLPPIAESERRWSFFHMAGLPRPLQAELDQEGVGGIRAGQWEDGLLWIGTITDWQPAQGFTVTLEADTSQVHSPLPLAGIGGPAFDMIDDRYWIEPLNANQVRLHLYSTYRLTTRINFYGVYWTDFLLRDIQSRILYIVQHRAEAHGIP